MKLLELLRRVRLKNGGKRKRIGSEDIHFDVNYRKGKIARVFTFQVTSLNIWFENSGNISILTFETIFAYSYFRM